MKKLIVALLTISMLQPLVAMDRPEKKAKIDLSADHADGQSEALERAASERAGSIRDYPRPPEMPLAPELTPVYLNFRLRSAAASGDCNQIEQLLKEGADLHEKNNFTSNFAQFNNVNAFDVAVTFNQESACRLLISHGAHPTNDNLFDAAGRGHSSICALLIAQGINVEIRDSLGQTPLMIAAERGMLETCELLIANRANVHAQDRDGWTPLYHAAALGRDQTCKLLLMHGADPNAQLYDGESILIGCITSTGIELEEKFLCAKILLKYGANINTLSSGKQINYTPQARNAGSTPLMEAAAWPDLPLCELFLQYGADDTVQNIDGRTALTIARERNDANMDINPLPFNSIIALLSNPANIRAVILRRDNPRLQRTFANHSSICQALSKRELGWK